MPTPSYNENHAAPLSYVNDAVAASSQADRQWVTDNIASLVRGLYAAGEMEAAAIAQLKQWYDFQTEPQSLEEALAAIVMRQITAFRSGTLTVMPAYALSGIATLQSVRLSAVTTLENNVFQGDAALRELYLPVCTGIGQNALMNCSEIRELNLASFTSTILNGTFQNVTNVRYLEEYWGKSLLGKTYGLSTANTTKLMKLGVNAQLRQNLDLSDWSPSYVASYPDLSDEVLDAEAGVTTNAEQIDYSVRTCIAARLLPLQTEGQCSVTFSSLVYGLLSAETLAAFAAKNWSVGHN